MAQLTIQVPDELATRLEPLLHRLPEILAQLVETPTPPCKRGGVGVSTPSPDALWGTSRHHECFEY